MGAVAVIAMANYHTSASGPYMPRAYSHGEIQRTEGKYRENVGTRWGDAGPKFEARRFAAEKADESERRARRIRRDVPGKLQVDWQQRTIVEPGQEYAKYGSGSYEPINGIRPSDTLHGGTSYSKPTAAKQKMKDDQFKASTVQAGMDRDYHEMVMRRKHNPGDRSDADMKSAAHPDQSQAQNDWERKRRISKQHQIHVANQRDTSACPERLKAVTAKVSRHQRLESEDEAAFRAQMAAKMGLAPRAVASHLPEPVFEEVPDLVNAPVPSGIVEEAPYPTGRPANIASPAAPPSPEVLDAPGLHSRYQDGQEEPDVHEFIDEYAIPHAGAWGSYPAAHDIPYGYDVAVGHGYYPPAAPMFHGHAHHRSYPAPHAYGYY